ncbi:Hypothetical protein HDN1F_25310 [gamma proteobacterium HdN1]|nr:Hypothetical protein HDN1F_25310 [gamma proteobacterium HdN1]
MKRILLVMCAALIAGPVLADEVTDAIDEGSAAYKRGELGTAASQWEYASQLVRQAKADKVKKLLPAALSGWESGEGDASATSAAVLGGGINVSKQYTKGDDSVSIEITMDSPMLQSVLAMITNPQMAALSGMKVKKIKGNSAAVESSADNTRIQIVVGNSVLVVVDGKPEAAVTAYSESIDFAAISALK